MTKKASFRPDDWSEGGLLDDVDVVWEKVRFTTWDYDGRVTQPIPALCISMVSGDGEGTDQYYSAGRSTDWEPSEDGTQLIAIGRASSLNKSCNTALLIKSVIDAGFPADKIGDDITVFEGMQCHMVRAPSPRRKGMAPRLNEDGSEKTSTILLVSEILAMPGESKKGNAPPANAKGSPEQSQGPAREAPVVEANILAERATDIVMGILTENGKSLTKKALAAKVFDLAKEDPDRNTLVKMCYSDEFLSEGPWEYDRKKGVVGG